MALTTHHELSFSGNRQDKGFNASERQGLLAAATVRKIVTRAGEAARLGFPVHPYMLRHATGFKLTNEGHDTRVIQHYLVGTNGRLYLLGEGWSWNNASNVPLTHASRKCNR